ncbi:MAG: hypothetical protein JJE07_05485 [Flavobacteriaceae bacterium]|nr:hypothetical protein [Flavobacteriaceae bacterium]
MTSPFRIFPSSGYLNSQFQVISSVHNVELNLTLNGTVEKTLNLSKDNPNLFSKLDKPGEYIASCTIAGKDHHQKIVVDDALRLGSSVLKTSYIFEDVDFTFLLMKDRMLLYNEKTKQIITENRISPSEIRKIDNENFLFITRIGEGENAICNLGIFNTTELKITDEILYGTKDIFISEDNKIIWIEEINSGKIKCLSTKGSSGTFKVIKEFIDVQGFNLTNDNSKIFINCKEKFNVLNLMSNQGYSGEKTANNAVGNDGSIYYLDNEKLKYVSTESTKFLEFPIPPDGFNLNPSNYSYIGDNFTKTFSKMAFEEKFEEISNKEKPSGLPTPTMTYIRHEIAQEQQVEHTEFFDELYPSQNGIYHYRKIRKETLLGVTFKKVNDDWAAQTYSSLNSIITISYKNSSENIEIFRGTSEPSLEVFNSFLLFKNGLNQYLQSGSEKIKEFKRASTIDIININNQPKWLLEKIGEKYSLFDLSKPANPILEEVKIYNIDFFKLHNVLWYTENSDQYLQAYDLESNKKNNFFSLPEEKNFYIDYSHFNFKDNYFSRYRTEVLIHPKTGEVKDAAIGNIITSTIDLNKVITKRNQKIYLLIFNHSIKKYEETEIAIENSIYLESYISPNGNFLVLQNDTEEYVLFDIEKNQEVKFFSGKFLAFSKEGNLIFEDDERRSAKIIDPLTFEKLPSANYHHFRFLSPDQKLYAQVARNIRYYNKVKDKDITVEEVIELRKKLDDPQINGVLSNEDEKLEYEKRKREVENYKKVYHNTYKQQLEKLKIKYGDSFTSRDIIEVIKFTEIGICGTDKIIEVRLPDDIEFYNYTAFSYDNKYAALVYRLITGGGISFVRLDYDEKRGTLEIKDLYLSHYPKKATWVCGFSKNNYFAAYDSTGTTFLLRQDDLDSLFIKGKSKPPEDKIWKNISGKNYLCFSPTGRYMAMSEESYIPFPNKEYDSSFQIQLPESGNYGHQESGTLHILNTKTRLPIMSYYEHGDKMKYDYNKKIRFVSFSENEKRIMSMSNDGVVIVRNFNSPH